MIYITFNLEPLPCISIRDETLHLLIDFDILVVARPTLGFLVLALTAIPMNGAATLTVDFKNFFKAVCVPLEVFLCLLIFEPPSRWKCLDVKLTCFWQLHFGFWHLTCNFETLQFLFSSHRAEILINDRCPCLRFEF